MMELCDPVIDPFDPHNPLIFVPGLLTGTLIRGATKTSVVAKSPLTGIFGESSVGGSWGADGSRAAARQLGPEALALTVEVEGLEAPMHDPRAFWSSALNYACAGRGACHLEAVAFAVESGVTVLDLIRQAGLPEFEFGIAVVNGSRELLSYRPMDGETIELLPIISGG